MNISNKKDGQTTQNKHSYRLTNSSKYDIINLPKSRKTRTHRAHVCEGC